jgi:hypothetical protein
MQWGVGDGPWVALRGCEAWGGGDSATVGRHGVVGSGSTVALTGGARPTPKQGGQGLIGGPPLHSRVAAV